MRDANQRGASMRAPECVFNPREFDRQDARSRMAETGQSVRKPLFRVQVSPFLPGGNPHGLSADIAGNPGRVP